MTRKGEQGVALVISLFLMAAMSALAVSIMFLAQTETSASRNYRTMSQARYAGEAGVHKTLHYFTNTYVAPTNLSAFVTTVSPVTTTNGQPVILSSVAGTSSNYPDSAVVSAYAAATTGNLAVGSGSVTYGAIAKLVQMRTVAVYGGGSGTIQTWEITSSGTVPGTIPATVEVKAMLERDLVDAQTFAVFATGTGCGAIEMQGNVGTGSYDSASPPYTTTNSGGNVGTNGNLSIGGSVDVYGSLSSPRTGVGACAQGNVTALTLGGSVSPPSAGTIQLPQPITFPVPTLETTPPTGNMSGASICAAMPIGALCSVSGGTVTIDPMGRTIVLGNISGNMVLKGGNYIINSLGSGDITVGTSAIPGNTNVVIKLAGKTPSNTDMTTVMDMGGNALANPSMDPQRLQILYPGPGIINMRGGATAAAMIYAPNASVHSYGNADIFGSILTNTLTTHGNTRFFYDRRMSSTFQTFGNYVMSSFSWRKY